MGLKLLPVSPYRVTGSTAMPRGIECAPVFSITARSNVSRSNTSMLPVTDSVQYKLFPTQSTAISSERNIHHHAMNLLSSHPISSSSSFLLREVPAPFPPHSLPFPSPFPPYSHPAHSQISISLTPFHTHLTSSQNKEGELRVLTDIFVCSIRQHFHRGSVKIGS